MRRRAISFEVEPPKGEPDRCGVLLLGDFLSRFVARRYHNIRKERIKGKTMRFANPNTANQIVTRIGIARIERTS